LSPTVASSSTMADDIATVEQQHLNLKDSTWTNSSEDFASTNVDSTEIQFTSNNYTDSDQTI
ncbi:unnamed protein product, partial [Rotaria socialis]